MVILRRPVGLLATLALALTVASLTFADSYPTPTRDGRERIQRTGTCPVGFCRQGQILRSSAPRHPACLPGDSGQGLPVRHVPQRRLLQGVPVTAN